MKTVWVTGANRGIGQGFIEHYLQAGDRVIACCRDPEHLQVREGLTVEVLDLNNWEQIEALARRYQDMPIDILINNAGIYPGNFGHGGLDNVRRADLELAFAVNAWGPLKLSLALLPMLQRGQDKKIVCLSSSMASIANNRFGGAYAYRGSKTALNSLMRSLAIDIVKIGL